MYSFNLNCDTNDTLDSVEIQRLCTDTALMLNTWIKLMHFLWNSVSRLIRQ